MRISIGCCGSRGEGTGKYSWEVKLAMSLAVEGKKSFLIGREQHEQRHGLMVFSC